MVVPYGEGHFTQKSTTGKRKTTTTPTPSSERFPLGVEDLPGNLLNLFEGNVQSIADASGAGTDRRTIAPWQGQGILDQLISTGEVFDPFATGQHKYIQGIADSSKVIPGAEQAILDTFGDSRVFDPNDPITQSLIEATVRPIDRRIDDDIVALESAAARAGQAVGSRRFLGDALLRSRGSEDKTDVTKEILSAERARIEENKLNQLIAALQASPQIENARFFGADRQNVAADVTTKAKSAQIEANRIAAAISENKRRAEQEEFDSVFNANRLRVEDDYKRQELLNQAIQVALSGPRRPFGEQRDETFSQKSTEFGGKGGVKAGK